jgi:hypothetical protein
MSSTIVPQVVPESTRDGVDARNPDPTSSPVTVTQVLGMPAEQQGKKKRRTKEEIAADNAAKAAKKAEKESTLDIPETPANEIVRRMFATLKTHEATKNAIVEMYAVRKLFPPAQNVNKFAVGGVVEDSFTDLLGACSFECENVAATSTVIDINVKDGGKSYPFSLKSSGKLNSGIVLENYRGQKKAIPEFPPTILVVAEEKQMTIFYLDQAILNLTGDKSMYTHADSNLTMKGAFVRRVASRLPEEYILKFPAPVLPDIRPESLTRVILNRVRQCLRTVA